MRATSAEHRVACSRIDAQQAVCYASFARIDAHNPQLTVCDTTLGDTLAMANLEPTMFREYDLRGRVNESELNEYSVAVIAKAYGTMLRNRGIDDAVVGYDLRPHSEELSGVAIQALRSTGVNIVAIGRVLTPTLYSAQYYYNTEGGMMLTASHNPSGWLGFKLALGLSRTFGPHEMQELKALTVSESFAGGAGGLREENYIPRYIQDVTSRVSIERPIKALVNAGNGTAGPIVPAILREAGCEVAEFLTEPDLEFKRYFPNPSLQEMMDDTAEQTVKHGADIGFAFDGDGDRLGVTDERGEIVWPDRYMILLSREILKKSPGAYIVYDVKSSRALGEDIKAHGGKPFMWRTGHSYIKEKLHELNSPLAGEMSGHIFFGAPIYYGFDDATMAALKLAELLAKEERSFSELVAETPAYVSTPTLQAACADEVKYRVVSELTAGFIDEGYNVVMFENNPAYGARVEFEDGWGLVRASSNLPVLVMRFEAETRERLEEIQNLFRRKFSAYPEIGQTWESG
jgi:phosphomannomutase/phosphoglucomutase